LHTGIRRVTITVAVAVTVPWRGGRGRPIGVVAVTAELSHRTVPATVIKGTLYISVHVVVGLIGRCPIGNVTSV
jgi:hypothetical protein